MVRLSWWLVKTFANLTKSLLEYLQELNDTGSFPDEYEKIPMCFIKCYLESLGVISSDGKIVVEKAISAYQIDNEEDVDNCIKELSEFECFKLIKKVDVLDLEIDFHLYYSQPLAPSLRNVKKLISSWDASWQMCYWIISVRIMTK